MMKRISVLLSALLALTLCTGALAEPEAIVEDVQVATELLQEDMLEELPLQAEELLNLEAEDVQNSAAEAGEQIAANATGIAIDKTHFPDKAFRAYVREEFDTDGDGSLSDAECRAVTELFVGSKGIGSLKGVEHFTNLKDLYCEENKLTKLDVSKNTKLKELFCPYNKLTKLDVSKNTKLEDLWCDHNSLTALNLKGNPNLCEVDCSHNKLKTLSLGAKKYKYMYCLCCWKNKLNKLDISACPQLKKMISPFVHRNTEGKGSMTWLGSGEGSYFIIDPSTKVYNGKKLLYKNGEPTSLQFSPKKITVKKTDKYIDLNAYLKVVPATAVLPAGWDCSFNDNIIDGLEGGLMGIEKKGTTTFTLKTKSGLTTSITITVK